MHDARFTTFNVLGLGIALGFGCVILICGYGAPVVVPIVQQNLAARRQQRSFLRDQWIANHHLHLQRTVFQLTDQGVWSGQEDFVPVTDLQDMLEAPSLIVGQSNPDDDALYHSMTSPAVQHSEPRKVLGSSEKTDRDTIDQ